MKSMKKVFTAVLAFVLIAAVSMGVLSCGSKKPEESVTPGETAVSGTYGAGEKSFAFEVTDDKGTVTKFDILYSDEDSVGAALVKTGLISGEDSEYGLYVKTVNGLLADYDKDQSFWAFYVDGEMALDGVDSTPIEEGKTYAFIYTK